MSAIESTATTLALLNSNDNSIKDQAVSFLYGAGSTLYGYTFDALSYLYYGVVYTAGVFVG